MEDSDNSAIDSLIPVTEIASMAEQLVTDAWLLITDVEFLLQLVLLIVAIVPALLFANRLSRMIDSLETRISITFFRRLLRTASILSIPITAYVTLLIFRIILGSIQLPAVWISGAITLLSAWIVVRTVTLVIRSAFWSRLAFFVAWPIAALEVFGMLGPVIEQMQTLSLPLGENAEGQPITISLLDVVRTLIYFALLFWGANLLSKLLQQQIEQIEELSPAFKTLLGKVLNFALPIIALLIAFQIVGFNVATLAVFSGAVGLGIGLGLQRIVANFIAGFTMVADRSIKPNDVIEIDGTMGWVTAMQARYVALRTRDGTELLVPNERLMTEGVINWSRSDRVIRLHAPFGVSYNTADLEAVQELAIEAARCVDRVVDDPAPLCNLVGFGDSSVNFDLRFWIKDPEEGLSNVTSDVLMGIWKGLKEANIEIPFPQRDLHVKTWPPSDGLKDA